MRAAALQVAEDHADISFFSSVDALSAAEQLRKQQTFGPADILKLVEQFLVHRRLF